MSDLMQKLRSKPLEALFDICSLLALSALGYALIGRYSSTIGLSHDGFLMTFASFQGDLKGLDIIDLKDPGRPFVGLSITLAHWLAGGWVTGINTLQATSYTASALLVYSIVRLCLPTQGIWALGAATLKLVWSANPEIFDDSGIVIYFGEAIFWLAIANLILLSRRTTFGKAAVMMLCVTLASGTYQGLWPLIILGPLSLIVLSVLPWRARNTRICIALWFASAIPVMVWSIYVTSFSLGEFSPSTVEFILRVLSGMWNAIGVALINPFYNLVPMPIEPSDGLRDTLLIAIAGLGIWSVFGHGRVATKNPKFAQKAAFIAVVMGFFVVGASIAASAMKFEPRYSSRFMAMTPAGVLLILGGLSGLALIGAGRIGGLIAVLLVASFAVASCYQISAIGYQIAKAGFTERRFWEDVTAEMPRLDEGTVVVFAEAAPPQGVATFDWYSTRILRTLSDTHFTFFIGQRAAVSTSEGWRITTDVDLFQNQPSFDLRSTKPDVKFDREKPPLLRAEERTYAADATSSPVVQALFYDRRPKRTEVPREYLIPNDRVVVVSWDPRTRRLRIDRGQSNVGRVHPDVPSTYGHQLFPAATIARDRARAELAGL